MRFLSLIFLFFTLGNSLMNIDNDIHRRNLYFDEIENEISGILTSINYIDGNISVLNNTVYDHYKNFNDNYDYLNKTVESLDVIVNSNKDTIEETYDLSKNNQNTLELLSENVETNTQILKIHVI